MATNNFIKQDYFDLYISDMIDNETDDFDTFLFYEIKDFLENIEGLNYFEISLVSGYYGGVQTIINDKYCSIEFLNDYKDIDGKDIYQDFGYNKYILKNKVLKEINYINTKILPQLKQYGFYKVNHINRFSNGECIYEICK